MVQGRLGVFHHVEEGRRRGAERVRKQRLANIKRTNVVMASLGLKDTTKNEKAAEGGRGGAIARKRKQPVAEPMSTSPRRASERERKKTVRLVDEDESGYDWDSDDFFDEDEDDSFDENDTDGSDGSDDDNIEEHSDDSGGPGKRRVSRCRRGKGGGALGRAKLLGRAGKMGHANKFRAKKGKHLHYGGEWKETPLEATPEQDNCAALDLSLVPLDLKPMPSTRQGGINKYRGVAAIPGCKGVSDRKWKAQINLGGTRMVNLGHFDDEDEAGVMFARAFHKVHVMPPEATAAAEKEQKEEEGGGEADWTEAKDKRKKKKKKKRRREEGGRQEERQRQRRRR